MPFESGVGKSVTVWLPKELVTRLDALAEKGGLTRSKLVENMVDVSVNELEIMDELGIVATVLVIRDFREWFSARRKEVVSGDLFKA